MKRAIIYARVSTDDQAERGLSVDSQIEACSRKAEELGATVVKVYSDEAKSGGNDGRRGFQAAIDHSIVIRADFLVCWNTARFVRDDFDSLLYKRKLAAAKVRLVYASLNIDLDTNEGWLTDRITAVLDAYYVRQVSADTRRSMLSAARQGFFMGGRVPFGYQVVAVPGSQRKKLMAVPEEATVVALMFEQSARGIGAFAIAAGLNQRGHTLRGRPWNKNTVLGILKSEVYMGTVIFNRFDRKQRVERPESEWTRVQAHEPIVSTERFEDVRAGLSRREPVVGYTPGNTQHLFAGLMTCGLCGSGLKMATGTGRGRKVYFYYACNGALQGRGCTFKRLPADRFDAWAMDELLDRVLTRENVAQVLKQIDQAAADWVKDRAARRRTLVADLRDAEGRRARLYEVLEVAGRGAPGIAELGPRLRELNDQIKRLELALGALEDEQEPPVPQLGVSADEAASMLREMLTTCDSPRGVRDFVASIVAGVVVGPDKVRVDYHPECLVRFEGAAVRSTSNWLPDLGSNQGPTD